MSREGASFDVTPLADSTEVDDDLKAKAEEYHEALIELVASYVARHTLIHII